MFKQVFAWCAKNFLEEYISDSDINESNINLGILSGDLSFDKFHIKCDRFNRPTSFIQIKQMMVGRARLHIPWRNLMNEAVTLVIEGLVLLAVPHCDMIETESYNRDIKEKDITKLVQQYLSQDMKTDEKSSHSSGRTNSWINYILTWFKSYLNKVINLASIEIKNVHVRYEDHLSCERGYTIGVMISSVLLPPKFNYSSAKTSNRSKDANQLIIDKSLSAIDLSCYMHDLSPYNSDDTYRGYDGCPSTDIFNYMVFDGTNPSAIVKSHYMLTPTCLDIDAAMVVDVVSRRTEVTLEVSGSSVKAAVNPTAVTNAIVLSQNVQNFQNIVSLTRKRPNFPVIGNAVQWWRYAIDMVREQNKNFLPTLTTNAINQLIEDKFVYLRLWKVIGMQSETYNKFDYHDTGDGSNFVRSQNATYQSVLKNQYHELATFHYSSFDDLFTLSYQLERVLSVYVIAYFRALAKKNGQDINSGQIASKAVNKSWFDSILELEVEPSIVVNTVSSDVIDTTNKSLNNYFQLLLKVNINDISMNLCEYNQDSTKSNTAFLNLRVIDVNSNVSLINNLIKAHLAVHDINMNELTWYAPISGEYSVQNTLKIPLITRRIFYPTAAKMPSQKSNGNFKIIDNNQYVNPVARVDLIINLNKQNSSKASSASVDVAVACEIQPLQFNYYSSNFKYLTKLSQFTVPNSDNYLSHIDTSKTIMFRKSLLRPVSSMHMKLNNVIKEHNSISFNISLSNTCICVTDNIDQILVIEVNSIAIQTRQSAAHEILSLSLTQSNKRSSTKGQISDSNSEKGDLQDDSMFYDKHDLLVDNIRMYTFNFQTQTNVSILDKFDVYGYLWSSSLPLDSSIYPFKLYVDVPSIEIQLTYTSLLNVIDTVGLSRKNKEEIMLFELYKLYKPLQVDHIVLSQTLTALLSVYDNDAMSDTSSIINEDEYHDADNSINLTQNSADDITIATSASNYHDCNVSAYIDDQNIGRIPDADDNKTSFHEIQNGALPSSASRNFSEHIQIQHSLQTASTIRNTGVYSFDEILNEIKDIETQLHLLQSQLQEHSSESSLKASETESIITAYTERLIALRNEYVDMILSTWLERDLKGSANRNNLKDSIHAHKNNNNTTYESTRSDYIRLIDNYKQRLFQLYKVVPFHIRNKSLTNNCKSHVYTSLMQFVLKFELDNHGDNSNGCINIPNIYVMKLTKVEGILDIHTLKTESSLILKEVCFYRQDYLVHNDIYILQCLVKNNRSYSNFGAINDFLAFRFTDDSTIQHKRVKSIDIALADTYINIVDESGAELMGLWLSIARHIATVNVEADNSEHCELPSTRSSPYSQAKAINNMKDLIKETEAITTLKLNSLFILVSQSNSNSSNAGNRNVDNTVTVVDETGEAVDEYSQITDFLSLDLTEFRLDVRQSSSSITISSYVNDLAVKFYSTNVSVVDVSNTISNASTNNEMVTNESYLIKTGVNHNIEQIKFLVLEVNSKDHREYLGSLVFAHILINMPFFAHRSILNTVFSSKMFNSYKLNQWSGGKKYKSNNGNGHGMKTCVTDTIHQFSTQLLKYSVNFHVHILGFSALTSIQIDNNIEPSYCISIQDISLNHTHHNINEIQQYELEYIFNGITVGINDFVIVDLFTINSNFLLLNDNNVDTIQTTAYHYLYEFKIQPLMTTFTDTLYRMIESHTNTIASVVTHVLKRTKIETVNRYEALGDDSMETKDRHNHSDSLKSAQQSPIINRLNDTNRIIQSIVREMQNIKLLISIELENFIVCYNNENRECSIFEYQVSRTSFEFKTYSSDTLISDTDNIYSTRFSIDSMNLAIDGKEFISTCVGKSNLNILKVESLMTHNQDINNHVSLSNALLSIHPLMVARILDTLISPRTGSSFQKHIQDFDVKYNPLVEYIQEEYSLQDERIKRTKKFKLSPGSLQLPDLIKSLSLELIAQNNEFRLYGEPLSPSYRSREGGANFIDHNTSPEQAYNFLSFSCEVIMIINSKSISKDYWDSDINDETSRNVYDAFQHVRERSFFNISCELEKIKLLTATCDFMDNIIMNNFIIEPFAISVNQSLCLSVNDGWLCRESKYKLVQHISINSENISVNAYLDIDPIVDLIKTYSVIAGKCAAAFNLASIEVSANSNRNGGNSIFKSHEINFDYLDCLFNFNLIGDTTAYVTINCAKFNLVQNMLIPSINMMSLKVVDVHFTMSFVPCKIHNSSADTALSRNDNDNGSFADDSNSFDDNSYIDILDFNANGIISVDVYNVESNCWRNCITSSALYVTLVHHNPNVPTKIVWFTKNFLDKSLSDDIITSETCSDVILTEGPSRSFRHRAVHCKVLIDMPSNVVVIIDKLTLQSFSQIFSLYMTPKHLLRQHCNSYLLSIQNCTDYHVVCSIDDAPHNVNDIDDYHIHVQANTTKSLLPQALVNGGDGDSDILYQVLYPRTLTLQINNVRYAIDLQTFKSKSEIVSPYSEGVFIERVHKFGINRLVVRTLTTFTNSTFNDMDVSIISYLTDTLTESNSFRCEADRIQSLPVHCGTINIKMTLLHDGYSSVVIPVYSWEYLDDFLYDRTYYNDINMGARNIKQCKKFSDQKGTNISYVVNILYTSEVITKSKYFILIVTTTKHEESNLISRAYILKPVVVVTNKLFTTMRFSLWERLTGNKVSESHLLESGSANRSITSVDSDASLSLSLALGLDESNFESFTEFSNSVSVTGADHNLSTQISYTLRACVVYPNNSKLLVHIDISESYGSKDITFYVPFTVVFTSYASQINSKNSTEFSQEASHKETQLVVRCQHVPTPQLADEASQSTSQIVMNGDDTFLYAHKLHNHDDEHVLNGGSSSSALFYIGGDPHESSLRLRLEYLNSVNKPKWSDVLNLPSINRNNQLKLKFEGNDQGGAQHQCLFYTVKQHTRRSHGCQVVYMYDKFVVYNKVSVTLQLKCNAANNDKNTQSISPNSIVPLLLPTNLTSANNVMHRIRVNEGNWLWSDDVDLLQRESNTQIIQLINVYENILLFVSCTTSISQNDGTSVILFEVTKSIPYTLENRSKSTVRYCILKDHESLAITELIDSTPLSRILKPDQRGCFTKASSQNSSILSIELLQLESADDLKGSKTNEWQHMTDLDIGQLIFDYTNSSSMVVKTKFPMIFIHVEFRHGSILLKVIEVDTTNTFIGIVKNDAEPHSQLLVNLNSIHILLSSLSNNNGPNLPSDKTSDTDILISLRGIQLTQDLFKNAITRTQFHIKSIEVINFMTHRRTFPIVVSSVHDLKSDCNFISVSSETSGQSTMSIISVLMNSAPVDIHIDGYIILYTINLLYCLQQLFSIYDQSNVLCSNIINSDIERRHKQVITTFRLKDICCHSFVISSVQFLITVDCKIKDDKLNDYDVIVNKGISMSAVRSLSFMLQNVVGKDNLSISMSQYSTTKIIYKNRAVLSSDIAQHYLQQLQYLLPTVFSSVDLFSEPNSVQALLQDLGRKFYGIIANIASPLKLISALGDFALVLMTHNVSMILLLLNSVISTILSQIEILGNVGPLITMQAKIQLAPTDQKSAFLRRISTIQRFTLGLLLTPAQVILGTSQMVSSFIIKSLTPNIIYNTNVRKALMNVDPINISRSVNKVLDDNQVIKYAKSLAITYDLGIRNNCSIITIDSDRQFLFHTRLYDLSWMILTDHHLIHSSTTEVSDNINLWSCELEKIISCSVRYNSTKMQKYIDLSIVKESDSHENFAFALHSIASNSESLRSQPVLLVKYHAISTKSDLPPSNEEVISDETKIPSEISFSFRSRKDLVEFLLTFLNVLPHLKNEAITRYLKFDGVPPSQHE